MKGTNRETLKMVYQLKILLIATSMCLFVFYSCDEPANMKKPSVPEVVTGKIPPPVAPTQSDPPIEKSVVAPEKQTEIQKKMPESPEKKEELSSAPNNKTNNQVQEISTIPEELEFYNARGRIDPFLPLIQEKVEVQPISADDPQRVLTPLEKIELSQIRLVAVVTMKNKKIAMVEEATGKGYEVTIGTYIGKNQGKVSEINDGSIIIAELVKDVKGKLKEQTQEIKLHKKDEE